MPAGGDSRKHLCRQRHRAAHHRHSVCGHHRRIPFGRASSGRRSHAQKSEERAESSAAIASQRLQRINERCYHLRTCPKASPEPFATTWKRRELPPPPPWTPTTEPAQDFAPQPSSSSSRSPGPRSFTPSFSNEDAGHGSENQQKPVQAFGTSRSTANQSTGISRNASRSSSKTNRLPSAKTSAFSSGSATRSSTDIFQNSTPRCSENAKPRSSTSKPCSAPSSAPSIPSSGRSALHCNSPR